MKTNLFDPGKRKFFLKSIFALAALKLASSKTSLTGIARSAEPSSKSAGEINYFQPVDVVTNHDVRAMRAVRKQIHERQQIKPGEHVLLVGDFATPKEMIEAFASAVAEAGAIPTIMIMPNSGWDPWPLRTGLLGSPAASG